MSWICVKHWPRTKFSIDPTAVQSPCLVETEPRTERTGTPFQYSSPWRMVKQGPARQDGSLLPESSPASYISSRLCQLYYLEVWVVWMVTIFL